MSEIIVAVKGVLIKNGKMLIVQRSHSDSTGAGTWESIGGTLLFGESFEQALQREFLEEAGLNIRVDKLLFTTTFLTSERRQIVLITFLCQSDECDDMHITLSNEHEAYIWATKEVLYRRLPSSIIDDYEKFNVFKLIES